MASTHVLVGGSGNVPQWEEPPLKGTYKGIHANIELDGKFHFQLWTVEQGTHKGERNKSPCFIISKHSIRATSAAKDIEYEGRGNDSEPDRDQP